MLFDVAPAPPRGETAAGSCGSEARSCLELRHQVMCVHPMWLQLQFLLSQADDLMSGWVRDSGDHSAPAVSIWLKSLPASSTLRLSPKNHIKCCFAKSCTCFHIASPWVVFCTLRSFQPVLPPLYSVSAKCCCPAYHLKRHDHINVLSPFVRVRCPSNLDKVILLLLLNSFFIVDLIFWNGWHWPFSFLCGCYMVLFPFDLSGIAYFL